MPQSQNVRQSEIQNTAAHTHDKAAASHTQNTTLTAHEETRREQEAEQRQNDHAAKLEKESK